MAKLLISYEFVLRKVCNDYLHYDDQLALALTCTTLYKEIFELHNKRKRTSKRRRIISYPPLFNDKMNPRIIYQVTMRGWRGLCRMVLKSVMAWAFDQKTCIFCKRKYSGRFDCDLSLFSHEKCLKTNSTTRTQAQQILKLSNWSEHLHYSGCYDLGSRIYLLNEHPLLEPNYTINGFKKSNAYYKLLFSEGVLPKIKFGHYILMTKNLLDVTFEFANKVVVLNRGWDNYMLPRLKENLTILLGDFRRGKYHCFTLEEVFSVSMCMFGNVSMTNLLSNRFGRRYWRYYDACAKLIEISKKQLTETDILRILEHLYQLDELIFPIAN